MLTSYLSGLVAKLTTKTCDTLQDVSAFYPSLELKNKNTMFKRRHLYPKRVAARRWNVIILSGLILVGIMSEIIATPRVEAEVVQPPSPIEVSAAVPWGPAIPTKIGASKAQNDLIAYAWKKWADPTFLYLLEAESGVRMEAKHINSDGSLDEGLCQVNHKYHPEVVSNPNFKDPIWQINQCYRMYSGGVTFYGLRHIARAKHNFKWQT